MSAKVLPIVCAWCERVRTTAGSWEEAQPAAPAACESTHGICPDCLAEVQHAASLEPSGPVPLSAAPRLS